MHVYVKCFLFFLSVFTWVSYQLCCLDPVYNHNHNHNHESWSCIVKEGVYKVRAKGKYPCMAIVLRPMKLDYQFLDQIFENLMRAGGYYLLFIIF